MKDSYSIRIISVLELAIRKAWLLSIILVSGCIPDEMEVPPQSKCCLGDLCINLAQAYLIRLDSTSNPVMATFQINLTSAGGMNDPQALMLVLNSNDPTELLPGEYKFDRENWEIPGAAFFGQLSISSITLSETTGNWTYAVDRYYAYHGSVRIDKNGGTTTFTISLSTQDQTITGYFKGVLNYYPSP